MCPRFPILSALIFASAISDISKTTPHLGPGLLAYSVILLTVLAKKHIPKPTSNRTIIYLHPSQADVAALSALKSAHKLTTVIDVGLICSPK